MPADTIRQQSNFKTNSGTLVNVYAATGEEHEEQLRSLPIAAIVETEAALLAASNAGSLTQPQQGVQQQTAPQQQRQSYHQATPRTSPQDSCFHGPYIWRDFISKAGKPIKGWFCPSQQRTDCPPKYVN